MTLGRRRNSEEEANSGAQEIVASNSRNMEGYELMKQIMMVSWHWVHLVDFFPKYWKTCCADDELTSFRARPI